MCSTRNFAHFLRIYLAIFYLNLLHTSLINSQNVGIPKLRLSENVPIGTKVTSLADLGISVRDESEIMLNPSEPFRVMKESTGQYFIETAIEIDREDRSLCKLTRQNDFKCIVVLDVVSMFEILDPQSHQVEIEIEDENDNIPQFADAVHQISIPENTQPSVSAISIPYATDSDSAEFAIQNYTLVPVKPIVNPIFSLKVSDRSDGVLIPKLLVVKSLDYESDKTYMLELVARDPSQQSSMLINITIIDVNDNTPLFRQSEQKVEILESDPVGKVVMKVEAFDPDDGKNGEIFYRFAEETLPEILEYFTIDERSGEIVLSKSLKSQGGQTLSVQVEARDGGMPPMTDLMTTEFEIKDVNDNKPRMTFIPNNEWEVDGRTIYFSENEEPKVIGFFKVSDDDPGIFGRTELKQNNGTENFALYKIGPGMYSLSTKKTFDREETDAYWVHFEASDCVGEQFDVSESTCSPLKTSEVFTFYVGDVNDFKPRFQKFRYNYTVVEETDPKILDSIIAEDEDYGLNGTIKFEIRSVQHQKWFHIDPDTGVFKTLRKLDREVLGSIVNVSVVAEDLGTPSAQETKIFEIVLIDIDDNVPKFNQSSYTFKVIEGLGIGKPFGKVTAIDPDLDGCVNYYASEKDVENALFEVDPTSGTLMTKKDFDFETEEQKEFYFEIYASDCKNADQIDLVRANILLIDDNDNSPKILSPQPLAEFSFPWDADLSYVVTTIEAEDADSGRNAKLTYQIRDALGLFGADPDRGTVFVKSKDIYKNKDRKVVVDIWVSDNGLQRNEVKQQNFMYFDGNVTLYNHTFDDHRAGVAFLPSVPRFMVYAVISISAIVLLIIFIWLVLLIRLRSSRSSHPSSLKAQYSAVAGEAQIHQHSHHRNQYTLGNGTLGRQSPLGTTGLNGSHPAAFMKGTYPAPATDGCDNTSRGTPSPDDSSRNLGTGTMVSGSLHSSQLSTFNERGGMLSPNSKYSNTNTLEAPQRMAPDGSLDKRRNYTSPGTNPMIHYPTRSCHPLAAPNASSSSNPAQLGQVSPSAGGPPGFQHGPQYPMNHEAATFQNRYAAGHPPPYDSRNLGYDGNGTLSMRNTHATFHPARSPSEVDTSSPSPMYPAPSLNSNPKKWHNHVDEDSPQGRPAPGILHIGKPPANSLIHDKSKLLSPHPQSPMMADSEDISPEVPPRPMDPDHPKNIPGAGSRAGNQILFPPLSGHERWNLPNENSFRGVLPTSSALSSPTSPNFEAPDLCKDVKSSLERYGTPKQKKNAVEDSRFAHV